MNRAQIDSDYQGVWEDHSQVGVIAVIGIGRESKEISDLWLHVVIALVYVAGRPKLIILQLKRYIYGYQLDLRHSL